MPCYNNGALCNRAEDPRGDLVLDLRASHLRSVLKGNTALLGAFRSSGAEVRNEFEHFKDALAAYD